MSISWSAKRQLIYGGSTLLVLVAILTAVFFSYFYKVPTCTDGVKNGDEEGVDCGGSCAILCTNIASAPVVLWAKAFNVSGGLYSVVAYIENPNVNSKNPKADYEFKIFDDKNLLIESRTGSISIPKNKKFAVFEPGFDFKNRKPKYVDFEFTSFAPWEKDNGNNPDISVSYSSLLATSTAPRIEGRVTNNSFQDISEMEVVGFVADSKENVVAVSRTFVDNLLKKTSQDFVFTWPKPFDLGVEACVSDVDVALALDRSGSMMSESKEPPEPFSTVKGTAQGFVKNLPDNDLISVVSFGTNASKESDLSANKNIAIEAIDNLSIGSTTAMNTNITEGLGFARDELLSQNAKSSNKKAIVLLTDGAPTEPKNPSEPDYPRISAESLAREIISSGISIYTIGLGKDVNEGFLKTVAGDPTHYYFAPDKDALAKIYSQIGNSICSKKPNLIIVNYRIP